MSLPKKTEAKVVQRPSMCASTKYNTDSPKGNSNLFCIPGANKPWFLTHQAPLPCSPPTHTSKVPSHRNFNKLTDGMPNARVYYFPNALTFLWSRQLPGTQTLSHTGQSPGAHTSPRARKFTVARTFPISRKIPNNHTILRTEELSTEATRQ